MEGLNNIEKTHRDVPDSDIGILEKSLENVVKSNDLRSPLLLLENASMSIEEIVVDLEDEEDTFVDQETLLDIEKFIEASFLDYKELQNEMATYLLIVEEKENNPNFINKTQGEISRERYEVWRRVLVLLDEEFTKLDSAILELKNSLLIKTEDVKRLLIDVQRNLENMEAEIIQKYYPHEEDLPYPDQADDVLILDILKKGPDSIFNN